MLQAQQPPSAQEPAPEEAAAEPESQLVASRP